MGEADTGHSAAGNGHIDAVAGVGDAEARMTDTAYDMEEVHVSDGVSDALTGVGAPGNGGEVDAEAGGGLAGVRDVVAEGVGHTYGAVAGAEDSQERAVVAVERWPWNVHGGRMSWTAPQAPKRDRFPIPRYSEAGWARTHPRQHPPLDVSSHDRDPSRIHARDVCGRGHSWACLYDWKVNCDCSWCHYGHGHLVALHFHDHFRLLGWVCLAPRVGHS